MWKTWLKKFEAMVGTFKISWFKKHILQLNSMWFQISQKTLIFPVKLPVQLSNIQREILQ